MFSDCYKMLPFIKYASRITTIRFISSANEMEVFRDLFQPPINKWTNIIGDFERRVNYFDSLDNTRYITKDNFNPLLDLIVENFGKEDNNTSPSKFKLKINSLLYGDIEHIQPWGLTVLLLFKSLNKVYDEVTTKRIVSTVEATEAFKIGYRIHRSVPNVALKHDTNNSETNIIKKIMLLIGFNFFLEAHIRIASIKNGEAAEIIYKSVRDLSTSLFFGDIDVKGIPLPGKPNPKRNTKKTITFDLSVPESEVIGDAEAEWVIRTMFDPVNQFASSCKAAMVLSGQSEDVQDLAYNFGCHLGLAWTIATELKQIYTDKFSITSAPVLFALNSNPELYTLVEEARNCVADVNLDKLNSGIMGTDAIERSTELYMEHVNKAIECIEKIGQNENVDVIKRLIAL